MADLRAPRHWTIVTVTYNSAQDLRSYWQAGACGESRWLVVDNNSTDNSISVARALGAEVISLRRNVGFSAANNIGLTHVQSEWVAFVNPDVTIADPRDFSRLAGIATANRSFVAPQLLNPDGTEQPNARGLPYPLHKLAHRSMRLPGVDLKDYARTGFTSPIFVAWAMGAAFAGRTIHFQEIGGWDERFFLYYEDHDIGLRAWAQGKPVVVDPSVRWLHKWQRATRQVRIRPWLHELRSAAAFYGKYPSLLGGQSAQRSQFFMQVQSRTWQRAKDV